MASKKQLAQIDFQTVPSLINPEAGYVGLSAKSDGLYQRRPGAAEEKLLTSIDASILVNQTAHGFSVGNAVGLSGSTWIKAKADSVANAVTIGLVSQVVDANNFRYVKGGILAGTYTPGANYFLSTTVAGALMTLAEPEVWSAGNVRQYIGTGTKTGTGLDLEIDIGDEISFDVVNDKHVDGVSYNEATRVLTLTRTAGLPSLSVAIPYPSSDIAFEARDVTKGVAQTYVLDMMASWPYIIQSIVCESNGTLSGVSVKINSTPVGGLSSLIVGTKAESTATSSNSVAKNDVVTINTSASYSGSPTLIRVKMKIKRV
ncbi:MAG TPA: hypothetical protein DHV48_10550 [Prolixibacteraceae bacterium]|nr:hypothetical protein [Prolixibacteraceae bacterium]